MIKTLDGNQARNSATPKIQKVIAILWPSFLTAGLATMLFFTIFDPDIILLDTVFANASRMGTYTVGFFSFWLLTASSCALTCYFQKPCAIVDNAK
jgi:hypothetical protein